MPAYTNSFSFLLLYCSCLFTCTSCLDVEGNPIVTENVSVKQNSSVDYSLGTLSVEAGAVVEMHPAHAEVSELVREQTGEIKYKYKPQPGFKGKDYVQIRFAKGTNGTSESTLIKITKINLIVEE